MDGLKKIKLTAGLSSVLLLGGGAAVRDVTVLDVPPIERVEIIAGERVEAKQIENVVEATFPWKDQPGIKVKYDMGEPTLEEKASDVRKKQVITETVTDFEGGFKVDIILSEKPDTNRFCYTIEGAENYDFFYQAPLTQEEIANGDTRPPEIEGSYAVYHSVLKNNNYQTGKVMHIPRPQVWSLSDENTKEWADLSYEAGQLCVTTTHDFLDKAEYPVRIDPVFGYTSVGATGSFWSDGTIEGSFFDPGVSGTLTSVSAYWTNNTATGSRYGLYEKTSGDLNGYSDAVGFKFANEWTTANLVNGTLSITAQEYWIAVLDGGGNGARYDTVSNAGINENPGYDWNNVPPATVPTSPTLQNLRFSIYATYDTNEAGTYTDTYGAGAHVWTVPTGVTSAQMACWGGGGGADVISTSGGGGGGGGAFASTTVTVVPATVWSIYVGAGGDGQTTPTSGGNSSIALTGATSTLAAGGTLANGTTGGAGGTTANSSGTVEFAGGLGGNGNTTGDVGGGGGGAAGPNAAGGAGANGASSLGGGGGGANNGASGNASGVTGGTGANGGGNGGNAVSGAAGLVGSSSANGGGGGGGGDDTFSGGLGGSPGGGGGGAEAVSGTSGDGAPGQCTITYTIAAAEEEQEATVTPYTTIKGDVQMKGDVYFAP